MISSKLPFSALARVGLAAFLVLSSCAPERVVVVRQPYAPPAVGPGPGAPPPPQVEVVGVAPRPGALWVRGHYAWRYGRWVWIRGHWRWA